MAAPEDLACLDGTAQAELVRKKPDSGDVISGLVVEHTLNRSVRDSAALLDATAGPDVGAEAATLCRLRKEAMMQIYVTLHRYSGPVKGGGPERFEKVKQILADEGGRILQIYGLLGEYDALSVAEFPDNRKAMRAALRVGNLIGARTNTMAAVEGEDFLKILSEV